jgi:hypothetical protein
MSLPYNINYKTCRKIMGVQKMESVYQLQKLVNDMDDDKFLQAECLLCNYTQNS